MNYKTKSIRPFIGAQDYELCRSFYRDIGFAEIVLSDDMCLFITGNTGFYLQKAYVKDWIDNTMIFLEVDDANRYYKDLQAMDLSSKYPGVRLIPMKQYDWGNECFLHDPSGILWHFGQFNK